MIIRILIIGVLIITVSWAFVNHATSDIKVWKKVGILAILVLGIIAAISPGTTNTLAHKVGVGRGADLMLYILTLAFIVYVIAQSLHNRFNERKMVILARKTAILEASLRQSKRFES